MVVNQFTLAKPGSAVAPIHPDAADAVHVVDELEVSAVQNWASFRACIYKPMRSLIFFFFNTSPFKIRFNRCIGIQFVGDIMLSKSLRGLSLEYKAQVCR